MDESRVAASPSGAMLLAKMAKASPDQEYEVSRHRSLQSARARVYQMRRTEKWGQVPLDYRAEEIDDGEGGRVAVVMARYSESGPDLGDGRRASLPQLSAGVNMALLDHDQLSALLEAQVEAWEREEVWEVPAHLLVRYRGPRDAG